MIRRPPRSTRTDTLFPSTTLFRSHLARDPGVMHAEVGQVVDDLVVPVHLPLVDEDGDRRRGHRLAGGAGGEDGVGVDLPGRTELAYAVPLRVHHFPVLDDGDREDRKSTRLNSSH